MTQNADSGAVMAWQGLEHVGWMNDAGAFLWLGHPSVTEESKAKWLRPVFAPPLSHNGSSGTPLIGSARAATAER